MFPKRKVVRLEGKALADLVKRIYERDGGCCVRCGMGVPEGTKPHHEPFKSQGGQDIEEDMFLLCGGCHQMRHISPGYMQSIKEFLVKRKVELYGARAGNSGDVESVRAERRNDNDRDAGAQCQNTERKVVSNRSKKAAGKQRKPTKVGVKKVSSGKTASTRSIKSKSRPDT
jgi:hypothetical protein